MNRLGRSLVLTTWLVVFATAASAADTSDSSWPQSGRRSTTSVILASEAGAALNSDLTKGGGGDDTAVLQRLLDRAAGGKAVHLIVDGPALVSGLSVHGNTTIECTAGGGFYLKDNSSSAIIRNVHRSRESVLDENIQIRGCFFNGNKNGQQFQGPEKSAYRRNQLGDGTFRSGLQFFGVNYLSVENVILWNTRGFATWIGNAKFITVRNVVVDTKIPPFPGKESLGEQKSWSEKYGANTSNDDGLHFSGPIKYLTVDGVKLRTWDDSIALAANDWGWGTDDITINNEMGPYVGQGPITDVTISNVLLMDSHHGFRLLSSNQRIDRVLIQNVAGTIRERMAVLSHMGAPSLGNFGSITFSNVNVDSAPHPPWKELHPDGYAKISTQRAAGDVVYDPDEEGELPLFSINGAIENLGMYNVITSAIDDRPVIRIGRDAFVQKLVVALSIHDPKLRAIPLRLLGRVERLKLDLEWAGPVPISYEGGKIMDLELNRGALTNVAE